MERINMQKSKVTQFAADNYFAPSHLYNMANFPRQQNKFNIRWECVKLLPISAFAALILTITFFSLNLPCFFSISFSTSLCVFWNFKIVSVSMLEAHNGMVVLFIISAQYRAECLGACVCAGGLMKHLVCNTKKYSFTFNLIDSNRESVFIQTVLAALFLHWIDSLLFLLCLHWRFKSI